MEENGDGKFSDQRKFTSAKKRMKTIRTPEDIQKVKEMIKSDNPPTQKAMARRVGVQQPTIGISS